MGVRRARRGAQRPDGSTSGSAASCCRSTARTRHLAAEIGGVEPRVGSVTADARRRTADLRPTSIPSSSPLGALAAQLDGTSDPRAAADLACQALDILRNEPSDASPAVRSAVRTALRRAVELEVQILADAIEGPASG